MARTLLRGGAFVVDGSIQRDDLDVSTAGQALIRKLIAGTGISLAQTGADAGTGDVTASASGVLLRAPQILTSGTSYTTPAGCTKIYVELIGGGGASGSVNGTNGNASGGAGSGAYAAKLFTVTPSTAYSYAIGAAGSPGASGNNNGGDGGDTTFTVGATTVTAGGGKGGKGASSGAGNGGVGGTATNGDLNVNGNPGGNGIFSTTTAAGGNGGGSFFGGAGLGSSSGAAGTSGSGGGGVSNPGTTLSKAGLAGGAGLIRIWEFS